MTIRQVLKKAKKGQKFSSKNAGMYEQTKKTLLFWMFQDKFYSLDGKKRSLEKINSVTDWEFDT